MAEPARYAPVASDEGFGRHDLCDSCLIIEHHNLYPLGLFHRRRLAPLSYLIEGPT